MTSNPPGRGRRCSRSRQRLPCGSSAVAVIAAAVLFAGAAVAQPRDGSPPPAEPPPVPPRDGATPPAEPAHPEGPPPKRALPDYDGRALDPPGERGALWAPRIVFYPLYLFFEHGMRRSLGWVVLGTE